MPDFTVARRGTDSSGRPILATTYFWRVWQAVLADERVRPFAHLVVVVQGAFMARLGGGASASAGYHDLGGCWDVRTWNLTAEQERILWAVAWEYAICFWKRDYAHGGMDEHGHAIAGWDRPLAGGAAYQWTQARGGRDGLASNGPDYMQRPNKPLPAAPPAELLRKDWMMSTEAEKKLDAANAKLDRVLTRINDSSAAERARDREAAQKAREVARRQIAAIGGVVDQLTELEAETDLETVKKRLRTLNQAMRRHLADDPDVDGADNPAPGKV
jgi:hypothetical protein